VFDFILLTFLPGDEDGFSGSIIHFYSAGIGGFKTISFDLLPINQ